MKRRHFLQAAAGTLAASQVLPAVASPWHGAVAGLALHRVLDRALPASPWFPAALEQPAQQHRFSHDVSTLWHETLQPLGAGGNIALSGYSRHASLFVLQTLAAEHAYQLVWEHARHDATCWLLLPRTGQTSPRR